MECSFDLYFITFFWLRFSVVFLTELPYQGNKDANLKLIEAHKYDKKYIWSNGPIPQNGLEKLCFNAQNLKNWLVGEVQTAVLTELLEMEPYAEDRQVEMLSCTFSTGVSELWLPSILPTQYDHILTKVEKTQDGKFIIEVPPKMKEHSLKEEDIVKKFRNAYGLNHKKKDNAALWASREMRDIFSMSMCVYIASPKSRNKVTWAGSKEVILEFRTNAGSLYQIEKIKALKCLLEGNPKTFYYIAVEYPHCHKMLLAWLEIVTVDQIDTQGKTIYYLSKEEPIITFMTYPNLFPFTRKITRCLFDWVEQREPYKTRVMTELDKMTVATSLKKVKLDKVHMQWTTFNPTIAAVKFMCAEYMNLELYDVADIEVGKSIIVLPDNTSRYIHVVRCFFNQKDISLEMVPIIDDASMRFEYFMVKQLDENPKKFQFIDTSEFEKFKLIRSFASKYNGIRPKNEIPLLNWTKKRPIPQMLLLWMCAETLGYRSPMEFEIEVNFAKKSVLYLEPEGKPMEMQVLECLADNKIIFKGVPSPVDPGLLFPVKDEENNYYVTLDWKKAREEAMNRQFMDFIDEYEEKSLKDIYSVCSITDKVSKIPDPRAFSEKSHRALLFDYIDWFSKLKYNVFSLKNKCAKFLKVNADNVATVIPDDVVLSLVTSNSKKLVVTQMMTCPYVKNKNEPRKKINVVISPTTRDVLFEVTITAGKIYQLVFNDH